MRIVAMTVLAVLLASGCAGPAPEAAQAPAAKITTPVTTYVEDPFATTNAKMGPAPCRDPAPSLSAKVRTSRWPGAYPHMAVFRLEPGFEAEPTLNSTQVPACLGWVFRMHTHRVDGQGTQVSYLQLNGTGLPLGVIAPMAPNLTYHYELVITDGRSQAVWEATYPDAPTRQVVGMCDPHELLCVTPAAQPTVSLSGNVSTVCKPSTLQGNGDQVPALNAPCRRTIPFPVEHPFHSKITVRMEYVYDHADLDFEVYAPDGRRAGVRASVSDATRLTGNRTEPDLVITDPSFVSQEGAWELRVTARAGMDAEFGFAVLFEV